MSVGLMFQFKLVVSEWLVLVFCAEGTFKGSGELAGKFL
jgi:hypothetical protein